MGFIASYLLSIVGVVLISVIVDLMLVNGQMQKYIKSILVIFIVTTIIAPIPKFLNVSVSSLEKNVDKVEIQQDFLDKVNILKETEIKLTLKRNIEAYGIYAVGIELDWAENGQVENVSLNLQNVVIQNKMENTNIYEILEKAVKEVLNLTGEIIYYE